MWYIGLKFVVHLVLKELGLCSCIADAATTRGLRVHESLRMETCCHQGCPEGPIRLPIWT